MGPITQWDKQQFVAEIHRKKAFYDALMAEAQLPVLPLEQAALDASLFALSAIDGVMSLPGKAADVSTEAGKKALENVRPSRFPTLRYPHRAHQ